MFFSAIFKCFFHISKMLLFIHSVSRDLAVIPCSPQGVWSRILSERLLFNANNFSVISSREQVNFQWIRVITKLPNSEQSNKGKVKTHKYINRQNQSTTGKLWNDDEICFLLDQHAELEFYSASSLKQQSTGRHVAPLWHIILIPSQPVFALSP